MDLEKLKYPIGRFEEPTEINSEQITTWIYSIETLPERLNKVCTGLSEAQLALTYRPGSWNVRQVIHHLADSHINSYCRFKLALTEDNAQIRPYDENLWSALPDAKNAAPQASLDLLNGLHFRWVALLKSLNAEQLKRSFYHPEHDKLFPLDETLAHYAWHSEHHLAQVEQALRSIDS